MISFFQLPKGVLKILNYLRSRLFWQGDSEKRKYRPAKWSVVCRPKDQGGLAVQDLEVKNRALLGKWLIKLLSKDGIWQTLLRGKYVGPNVLSRGFWGFSFLDSIMATKKFFFFPYGYFSIRDGSKIRFQED
jgi:hypothetical protein